jgi:hypothetical protein
MLQKELALRRGMQVTIVPRLSAAMTTPSLNLRATTDVPVTMGDCVC